MLLVLILKAVTEFPSWLLFDLYLTLSDPLSDYMVELVNLLWVFFLDVLFYCSRTSLTVYKQLAKGPSEIYYDYCFSFLWMRVLLCWSMKSKNLELARKSSCLKFPWFKRGLALWKQWSRSENLLFFALFSKEVKNWLLWTAPWQ